MIYSICIARFAWSILFCVQKKVGDALRCGCKSHLSSARFSTPPAYLLEADCFISGGVSVCTVPLVASTH